MYPELAMAWAVGKLDCKVLLCGRRLANFAQEVEVNSDQDSRGTTIASGRSSKVEGAK